MISFDQSGDANYQAAAQVLRNVTALNTAPVAQAQSVATSEDVPVDVILSGSDIDNGSLAFSIVTPAGTWLAGKCWLAVMRAERYRRELHGDREL